MEAWTNRGLEEVRGTVRRRQKAYKVLAMMSEALNSTLSFDWQHGQGFQSVLALHLHLLIKCHNNMIFNYQQLPPPLPRRDQQQRAEAKVWWTAKVQHIHWLSVSGEVIFWSESLTRKTRQSMAVKSDFF